MSSCEVKISNNPFRLLGVYANASIRDIKSNEAKANAFLAVGKDVSYPCDFNAFLSPIQRTREVLLSANSQLTLPNEKIKHALFWFVKTTPIDEVALNHLSAGNYEKALEIWEKKECYSSLLNISSVSLAKGQFVSAVNSMVKLLETESYRQDFVNAVIGGTNNISKEELYQTYLDALIDEEAVANTLLNLATLPNTYKKYIKDKLVSPIIAYIESEINKAKGIKHENAVERYNIGCKLLNLRTGKLSRLEQLLSRADMHYQMIVDKLGLEILQCGIDYYNNSDDDDAAERAMNLQSAAQSIVIGQMALDRCKENTKILREIIAQLPPKEVRAEDRAIKRELEKFCRLPDRIQYAIDLLNNTRSYLRTIKSRVSGSDYSYYLKISTQIAGNALHNIIEEVNCIQKKLEQSVENILREYKYHSLRESMKIPLMASALQNNLKPTLEKAWEAILLIDKLDLETDFKINRYNPNRNTLKNMCIQMGIITTPKPIGGNPKPIGGTPTNPSGTSGSSSGSGCMVWLLLAITLGTIISCI